MGSGSQWGMIIGFTVGAIIGIATGGAFFAVMQAAAIGGMIGGIAGGIIDPMDMPSHTSTGQRLEELQIMGVQEGSGVTKAYGDQIRLGGQLIGCGPIVETRHVTEQPDGGGGKKSFLAGTPIRMSGGTDKSIEDIKIGDMVRTAKFAKSGDGKLCFRNQKVTNTLTGETKRVLKISGENFSFSCTPEHSVYGLKPNREAEWFTAESLRQGDSLLSENGWVDVIDCERFELEGKTYNLTVKEDENYFADGVLVHNGKGGGGDGQGITEVVYYTYATDVMCAICEGPLRKVRYIYMNGKRKYKNVTTGGISGGDFTLKWWVEITGGTWNTKNITVIGHLRVTHTGGGSGDFSSFSPGMYADFDGIGACAGGIVDAVINANTIDVRVPVSIYYYQQGNSNWRGYFRVSGLGNTGARCPAEGPYVSGHDHPGEALHLDSREDADVHATPDAFNPNLMTRIKIYIGDDGGDSDFSLGSPSISHHYTNASADSLFPSGGNSPAYRGIAYASMQQLQLRDFGNQIPQFQFAVDAIPRETEINGNAPGNAAYATLGMVLDSVLIRQGFLKKAGIGGTYTPGDTINTDEFQAVNGTNRVRGFTSAGTKTAKDILSTLVLRYDLMSFERSGVLYFTSRNTTADKTIDVSLLGASTGDNSSVPTFSQSDKDDSLLPNEVTVDYYDVQDNYQRGSQKSTRAITGLQRTTKIDVAMGLRSYEAQEIANRVLYQSHAYRKRCRFTLPPSEIDIQENDLLLVSVKGEGYSVRVLELSRGADFTHEIVGLLEGSESVPYDGEGDEDSVDIDEYVPPIMKTLVMDTSPLHGGAVTSPSHYIVSCTLTEDQEFTSAGLWASDESDGVYYRGPNPSEGMLVEVDSSVSDGPTGVWDDTTEITIKVLGPLSSNSPASSSEEDALNGKSLLYLEGEIIGFRDVEGIGDREYKLSKLIRGIRGTEHYISTHTSETSTQLGAVLTYADGGRVAPVLYSPEKIGENRYYKAVSEGATVSDTSMVGKHIYGNSVKPFPVGGIKGYKDGNTDDWIVDFVRGDRAIFNLISATNTPNTDNTEVYVANIYDPSDLGTVVRTLNSNEDTDDGSGIVITQYNVDNETETHPRLTYSIDDQETDSTDALTSIVVEIYKVGEHISQGKYTQHTITNTRKY